MDQAKINVYTSKPKLNRERFSDFAKAFQAMKYSNLNDLNADVAKPPVDIGRLKKAQSEKKISTKKHKEIVYRPN